MESRLWDAVFTEQAGSAVQHLVGIVIFVQQIQTTPICQRICLVQAVNHIFYDIRAFINAVVQIRPARRGCSETAPA